MKKLLASLLGRDAAAILGAALISAGAGMIYRPAGLIVAGGLILTAAWRLARE